ncbi:MAG: coproporphyrinogen dehydrogenase HemZ [Defluviitaleaceae bacterium]|nr:coproporphyrinogen dehydrogenase HemZ [Defluviitaleaceae bacterium]
MTIRVIANHKYVDEIQSIAQIFFPHARFGGEDLPEFTISSSFDNGKVHAGLFSGSVAAHAIGTCSLELADLPTVADKRQAMLAMYRLLQATIGAYTPWGALTGVRPTKMVREWIASGQSENQIHKELQYTFHVHECRTNLAIAVAKAENNLAAKICSVMTKATPQRPTLGLYVSIPFCPSRCVYCSFNTASGSWSEQSQAQYITAVIDELGRVSDNLLKTGSHVSSVYIGGGTPTALTDGLLERLLSAIQTICSPSEYTIEAGRPDTITRNNLKIMRNYGITRISINPQTVNDITLKSIGRNHTTRDFLQAFELAREEGFTTINTDIIAGLPGEGPKDMHHTMETLTALTPENITVHTLAVKRASKLNELRADTPLHTPLPDAKTIESQLKIAHDACAAMGHNPYYLYRQKNMAALFENTGYSLPGHECLYNIGMMSEVQTVLGVGAGAVSKYIEGTKITRKFNAKNPDVYIQRIMDDNKKGSIT